MWNLTTSFIICHQIVRMTATSHLSEVKNKKRYHQDREIVNILVKLHFVVISDFSGCLFFLIFALSIQIWEFSLSIQLIC